jgi:hypothetical protein
MSDEHKAPRYSGYPGTLFQTPNTRHSRHQLPFGAVLEQVSESLKRPEIRGHASPAPHRRACAATARHSPRSGNAVAGVSAIDDYYSRLCGRRMRSPRPDPHGGQRCADVRDGYWRAIFYSKLTAYCGILDEGGASERG